MAGWTRWPARRASWVEAGLVAGVATAVVLASGVFAGEPPGFDTAGHAAKVRLLLDNFPHVAWNDAWYAGHAMFTGTYPPGFYVIVVSLAWAGGLSIEAALAFVGGTAMVATVASWYGFVRLVGRSRIGGLVAGGMLLAAPTFWAQEVTEGLYPRMLALAFVSAGLAAAAWYAARASALRLLLVVVLLTAALSSHPAVGAGGMLLAAAVVALAPAARAADRVVRGVAVIASSLALSAYFYLPLFLLPQRPTEFTGGIEPAPWRSLFWPGVRDLAALPTLLLPMLAALAVAVWITRRGGSTADEAVAGRDPLVFHGSVAVLAAGAAAMLAYVLVGHAFDFDRYVVGLEPDDLLVYVAWLLSGLAGLAASQVLPRLAVGWRRPTAAVMAAAVAASVLALVPHLDDRRWPFVDGGMRAASELLPPEASQGQLRVAGPTDATTKALNFLASSPQVRGYQEQAVPHPDWQFWLEARLHGPDQPAERRFLFDWYGIGWVYGTGPMLATFAAEPAAYTPVGETPVGGPLGLFEVRDASPILSARNTPATLVVAPEPAYEQFLRAMAAGGIGSEAVVVVRGGATLDSFTLAELRRFDSIVLYGADPVSVSRAAPSIARFVSDGGTVLLEAGGGPEAAAAFAAAGGPTPVTAAAPVQVDRAWELGGEHELLAGLDLRSFAPARFGTGSWGAVTATRVAEGAEVVLTTGNRPVVVMAEQGKGRVVWSGMNLPAHAAAYANAVEADLLLRLVLGGARSDDRPPPAFEARRVNSHHRVVEVTGGARGVLLKENVADGWRATVNGRRAEILPAGPDFMWVPLDGRGPVRVELIYQLVIVERAGWLVSLLAWLVVAGVLVRAGWRASVRRVAVEVAAARASQPGDGATTSPRPVEHTSMR